ncbi:MAG: (2Fe-2S) ferredoxin domain-containing protein [Bacteroidota bacterium]|nr:(2Fe-2S) ferredoxin domain-containing protein [Bacteroidota bacterium]MDP4231883.1 (2Fe-2S) ferredoxin domain-containing protein [Bacteroidota bacterium]MDP4241410.1 (2Fe-2S) ferredoxin domain-containing protein [Bacteroidota bacterium]MDP4287333.1 (2Fe-2S) ferredoxin domain-containing protein [Bacteroidota bacterium]
MRFDYHIFICENVRGEDDPKGCCAQKGSPLIRAALKDEIKRRGLRGKVRANQSGCLDACEFGPSMVVYPEGIWYGGVKPEDVPEIIEQHIIGGKPVERLRIAKYREFEHE